MHSNPAHDELLVLAAQAGDRSAMGELVSRWRGPLWRHARVLTGRDDGAWDVLQEACVAMVRGVRSLADPASFRWWAFRLVTNKAADWVRSAQRGRRLVAGAAADPRPASEGVRPDELARVRRAVEQLPADSRVLLSLRYCGDLSMTEISLALRVPEGTVKSRLHQAREELRSILERDEP
jgi:RNA polymerase sigma-70 factor, ECF subfamily